MDRLYLQNRLLGMVGEDALESVEVRPVKEESVDLLDQLVAKARENGVLSELPAEQEIFEAQLMDFLTPPPSGIMLCKECIDNGRRRCKKIHQLCFKNLLFCW